MLDQLFDYLLLKRDTDSSSPLPQRTTGSIVSGALFRAFFVILLGFFLWEWRGDQTTWFITIILLWGYVVYPAQRQYDVFNKEMDKMYEETLCGQCKHFNLTNQLCGVYDEHPTKEYIPCDGIDWEPR
jgi:hypothetical protein